MAKVDFEMDDVELRTNIAEFGPKINKTITLTTDFGAKRGTKAMKLKAPWTDRTAAARGGLHTTVDHSGSGAIGFTKHEITFAHGVDYGIWLEICRGGKYEIIMPTVLAVGQEIMNALKDLLKEFNVPPEFDVNVTLPNAGRSGTSQRHGRTPGTMRSTGNRTNVTRRTEPT